MNRLIDYRGVLIAPHPTNPHRRYAWRSLTGRLCYAETLRGAKASIDREFQAQDAIIRDALAS